MKDSERWDMVQRALDRSENKLDKIRDAQTGIMQSIARGDESTLGVWREIKEDIKPAMTQLRSDLSEHIRTCPAAQRALKRAINWSTTPPGSPTSTAAAASLSAQSLLRFVPRPVVIGAVGLAVFVAVTVWLLVKFNVISF